MWSVDKVERARERPIPANHVSYQDQLRIATISDHFATVLQRPVVYIEETRS